MRIVFRSLRALMVALLWTGLFAARAHAHGGIAGPDELGPPVITSAILGIGGYWLMMMWPARGRPILNKKRKPARSAMK
jgi:hypothetical protein